jgi:hypothetical protein
VKRREALFSILGAASAASLPASARAQALSPEAVGGLLRTLAGLEPMPGEAESVLSFLLSFRTTVTPDPGVEPALTFDPEVDP